jgi:hypothetical protein
LPATTRLQCRHHFHTRRHTLSIPHYTAHTPNKRPSTHTPPRTAPIKTPSNRPNGGKAS